MPDQRDQDLIVYPREVLLWSAVSIFLLGLRSRRQFRFESANEIFVRNLNLLAGSAVETAPHDDTLAYYCEPLPAEPFEKLPVSIVQRLIRMKALDPWRLYGTFLVAVDGTGQLFFHKRHCPHCLTATRPDGTIYYFHHVLEAKLVTDSGLAFSVATEFIENADPNASKQDCEIKAFYRLAVKLKSHFPQLPITLLGDALYEKAPVMEVCSRNHWNYIFTFKAGSLPALFQEYQTLRELETDNRVELKTNDKTQTFAWVNDLTHEGHRLSAFECRETDAGQSRYFAWITNFAAGCKSVVALANQGGRCRWKIENQGFNIQKNHGYELEHAYSQSWNVAKIFYFLLQVAHAINQLILHGNLIEHFRRALGSLRNYRRRLAEAFRNTLVWDGQPISPFQIRLEKPP
jgi:hypothetical protein